jgi:hypothetical protein
MNFHCYCGRVAVMKGLKMTNISPPWWDGNIAIDFSTNEWEYVLNGLYNLIDNAYLWGLADSEVEEDVRNIIDRIEKNVGLE